MTQQSNNLHSDTTQVILVDGSDNTIGLAEKNSAHADGLLHRAFSIFIFNDKGEMLIQQRADEKYHSGGLWANSCCGHPEENELTKNAAERRLQQELGFSVTLTWHNAFIYRQKVSEQMAEHEYVHLYSGVFNQNPDFNENEVQGIKWIQWSKLQQLMIQYEELFSAWFVHYLKQHKEKIQQIVNNYRIGSL
ncbi:MAG: isopentenyl-diphosphate Delta-isomerase [Colwellia sp.]